MKGRKFISCNCYDHGIVIGDDFYRGKLLSLCIFKWGFDGDYRPGWWDRLKMMWEIWRHGHPYGDQILLDKKTLPELHDVLGEVIEEWSHDPKYKTLEECQNELDKEYPDEKH